METGRVTLWRLTWSHATGVYWLGMRLCDVDNASAWLAVFQKDETTATFCVAKKAPKILATDVALARHVATLK